MTPLVLPAGRPLQAICAGDCPRPSKELDITSTWIGQAFIQKQGREALAGI
jgi:hypothetical protein